MNFANKVAEELAKRRKNILPPIFIEGGGKIGMSNLGKLDQITTHREEYLSSFVDRLLKDIPEQLSLQFVELVLPTKAVDKTELQISENVLLRYIIMNEISTDNKMQRWDALIRLPNDYMIVGNKEKEHA